MGAQRVCAEPGCPERTDTGYCPAHTRARPDNGRPRSGRKINGYRHRKLTAAVVARDKGVCHICGKHGATSADHIVPVALGGAEYDLSNVKAAHIRCNIAGGAAVAAAKRKGEGWDPERGRGLRSQGWQRGKQPTKPEGGSRP